METEKSVDKMETEKSVDKKKKRKKIDSRAVLRAVVLIFLFIGFVGVIPLLVALSYSFGRTLMAKMFGVPLILLLFLLFCLILWIRYLRAIFKRRKMLKQLKRICEAKGYSLECHRLYRSVLLPREEPEITIQTGKELIECKLLCALSRKTPIFISSDGAASVAHIFWIGSRELFRHLVNVRYSFGEGDKKIFLIVPIPREVFQKIGNDFRPVFSGDRINDCAVYHTSTFLDALKLDSLD